MEEPELERLRRMVAQGDAAAAQLLLAEGRRRGDAALVAAADVVLGAVRRAPRQYNLKVAPGRAREDITAELNGQQRAVVQAGTGPMLVIAGAGSGKTRSLTHRVAYLIERGVAASRILLLTFTNKAAKEMLRRTAELLSLPVTQVWGGTFHHVGHRILRKHAECLGYPPTFSIMDGEDVKTLVGVCAAELKVQERHERFPIGDVHGLWSKAINTGQSLEEVIAADRPGLMRDLEKISALGQHYQARKRSMGLMDYDDLLVGWRELFREHPDIHRLYAERFEHVLVDEYQDTNHLQAQLVELCSAHHRNLMVVGDDAQSIYGFRGACFENIIAFPQRVPETKVYFLETNYRSTPQILALANASIRHNTQRFDKVLQPVRGDGHLPALVPLRDAVEQAHFVAARVLELNESGIPLRNMAVLYRAHYQSMEIQAELTRARIPFEVRSGLRFFELAHVKDVLAYLRLAHNPLDELSFMRVVKLCDGVGDKSAAKLWQAVAQGADPMAALRAEETRGLLPVRARASFDGFLQMLHALRPEQWHMPGEMIGGILDGDYAHHVRSAYRNAEHRLADIEQLSRYAARFESLEGFLADIALVAGLSGEDIADGGQRDDALVLSSVHQAKGLEWQVVFLTSLWEGGFPVANSLQHPEAMEEERRLFHVAVTRAKDELYLTLPMSRTDREGWQRVLRPSPFIQELEDAPGHSSLWELWSVASETV